MAMKKWKKCLKRNRTYLLLLLLFVLVRCDLLFNTSIRPEKPPYFQMGDTLVFKSRLNVDSFYVEKTRLYKPGETLEKDPKTDPGYYESFASSMIQIDCVDSCYKFTSRITPVEYWIGVYEVDLSSFQLREYWGGNVRQIGNYEIDDLYESYNINTSSTTGGEICTVFYSKKYGVVEYELTNGEVFDLEEACIAMMEERHKKK